jgi:prepilin-type N-terminal cleavage/methylation domain-containing protein
MRHRAGFTLVEMLVVAGIIALLIALLLPTLLGVRKVAYLAHCAANQHHVGIAVTVYALEHRGHLPTFYRTNSLFASYWMLRQQSNVPVNLGLVRNMVPEPENFYCVTQGFMEMSALRFDGPANLWPWDGDTWILPDNRARLRSSYYARYLPESGNQTMTAWKHREYSNNVIYTCFSTVDEWAGGGVPEGNAVVSFPHYGEQSNALFGDGAVHSQERSQIEDEAGRPVTELRPSGPELEIYYRVMDDIRR